MELRNKMYNLKVLWVIALFNWNVLGTNVNRREKPKTEGRQLQSFFPQQESASPNFQPSPSDVYFIDGSNQVQDSRPKQQQQEQQTYKPNPKFSPNLQNDLYTSQYGAQQQQQLLQQQQQQQEQQQQQQYQQQLQLQQQHYQYAQQSQSQPERPFYPTPDGNEVNFGEQQYSPQSQQYVDNSNFIYTEPPQYQSQSPYDQGYSQIVTGNYAVGNRPQVNILPQQRPSFSLYNPNQQHQYGGSSRPVYQSQQNYNLRPPQSGQYGGGNEGGIAESISNFFTNIGQGASELFSGRPPVNQYQPPPSVSAGLANRPPHPYNQQQYEAGGQQFGQGGPQFGQGSPQFGSGNGGSPFGGDGPTNPLNQFSKAIEEITRNDDYQCIPKVICQMVGSQRRQPSILSSPIFTAIISAVPSNSAGLVYGRAALLGLISGEHNCHTAYPRCPRNEDELLHYLNNHRGGFFRFFNGGAAFGDEQNNQYNPNQYQSPAASNQYYHQTHQNQPQPQGQPSDDGSVQSNLAALQNIAEAINSGGGINLSNLGANANLFSGLAGLLNGGGSGSSSGSGSGFDLSSLGTNAGLLSNFATLVSGTNQATKPSKAPPDDQGQSLTELVGNLLTGFVGQRFAGRKINKRSIQIEYDDGQNSTEIDDFHAHDRKLPKKVSAFKLKLAASREKLKFPEETFPQDKLKFPEEYEDDTQIESDDDGEQEDGVEGRILNKKPDIYSDDDDRYEQKFVFNSNRGQKNVPFMDRIIGPTPVKNFVSNLQVHFGDNTKNDEFRIASNHRSPKLVKFQGNAEQIDENRYQQQTGQDSVRFDNHQSGQDSFRLDHHQTGQEPVRFNDDYDTATHRPSKMIFPDRTGTGNLRFDRDEYINKYSNRYGKILNYGNNHPQNSNEGNRVTFGQTDRYTADTQQNYRPSFSNNYHQNSNYYQQNPSSNYHNNQNYPSYNRYTSSSLNRQSDDNSSQNVYVTNGEGKTVYYINAAGKKVYV